MSAFRAWAQRSFVCSLYFLPSFIKCVPHCLNLKDTFSSRRLYFCFRDRLEAVSRTIPCTEGAWGGSGVPRSEHSRALGIPGCGRRVNRCCLQHRSHQTKTRVHNEPPIFLYFTGFFGLLCCLQRSAPPRKRPLFFCSKSLQNRVRPHV